MCLHLMDRQRECGIHMMGCHFVPRRNEINNSDILTLAGGEGGGEAERRQSLSYSGRRRSLTPLRPQRGATFTKPRLGAGGRGRSARAGPCGHGDRVLVSADGNDWSTTSGWWLPSVNTPDATEMCT